MFDRLNRWLLSRLPSRRRAGRCAATPHGLHIIRPDGSGETLPWQQIERVAAARTGQLAGDSFLLLFGLDGGGVAAVAESDPGWQALAETLHEYLPGAMRHAMWALELAAGADSVEIYRR
jgi:hypothetical protein